MGYFSAHKRVDIKRELQTKSFDVLIIGGGTTGAGIALDAASRGLSVALVEMQDFGAGTSGRSTKLIHGGLRYLKQMEFGLVKEVGTEREIIHRNAPHLTHPEPMLLPIIKGGSLGKFPTRIAMWIYEWLAGVKKEEWHKMLSKDASIKQEPLLKNERLLGGVLFYEYRTDDSRLTIEVLKEAVNHGVTAINYLKAESFLYQNNIICGVVAKDQLHGDTFEIKATHVVNACGPWVDEVDDREKNVSAHKLSITKGVHLVVDAKKFPCKQALYFDTPDKRMIFIIPRDGKTYIGTTDTFYEGGIVHPLITKADRDYLIHCVNEFFPENNISVDDIESGWAGLRPLIKKPGKGPSEISRKDEMFVSESGMIIIAGGKLTGYRKMAQRVVDLLAKKIKEESARDIGKCRTEHIAISGGKLKNVISFTEECQSIIQFAGDKKIKEYATKRLLNRYGANSRGIIEASRDESELLSAELNYCIEHELCCTPCDFFIRRTGALYFDIDFVKKQKEVVVAFMHKAFGWSDAEKQRHINDLEEEMKRVDVKGL